MYTSLVTASVFVGALVSVHRGDAQNADVMN
jgi:hypothetical protein